MKKKILIVCFNDLGLGGIQNVIMNTVRHLSDEFIFDIVCFNNKRTDFNREFLSFGGEIFVINEGKRNSPLKEKADFYLCGGRLKRKIKQIIQKHGPYIAVHSHKDLLSGAVLKAAKQCGVPVRIAHAHTAFPKKYNAVAKLRVARLKKQIKKYATDMVGCSNNACLSLFGEGTDYKVIVNTVDEKYICAEKKNSGSKVPVLIQVGMICDNKNQAFSVSVLKNLKKKYSAAKLIIVGDPKDGTMQKYFDSVKASVSAEGLEDSISFLSSGTNLTELYGAADYMILPSRAEGLAIAALEAQAMGLTCFVSTGLPKETDCGGCVYLDLNSGAEYWAETIAAHYSSDGGSRKNFDISKFLPVNIMEKYRKLYKGELS